MVTTMSDTKYFPERTLEHGAWKKHKYIRKDGKKYIYQETRELDDGTSQDIYKDEETGETIHQNNNFKYDPERPDYRKKAVEKTKELVSKVTDKEDPDTGEKAKGDYVDDKEEKRKYFVKHSDTLAHHGILGQKWGVRRFQNKDGSLTTEGKKRVYAQGAYGGYESRQNRYKRSIQGAKYEKDIERNQKKLDKAYAKGNEKKIAKYELADKILKTNKDIMLKDLSENEIKQGRDYVAVQRSTLIGYIIAGPVGGVAAGAVTAHNRKFDETQRAIDREEVTRRNKYFVDKEDDEDSSARSAANKTPSSIMVTKDEAKKLGLDDSTRFTPEEESEFWKAYAAQIEKEQKKK